MFALGAATRIFLATGATDLRKGCNGLFALVRARWDRDALGGDLFLFCNRRRDTLKIFSIRRARCGCVPRVWNAARIGGHRSESRR